jgi:hypothetical protein
METEKLCLAWVKGSNNSVVGAGQKSKCFWEDVVQKFVNLSPPDCPAGTYRDRKAEGIKAYLKEHVFPSVHKFSSIFALLTQQTLQVVSGIWRRSTLRLKFAAD